MKVSSIKFNNFKMFSDLELILPDSNFIVFIGANASGKTSILDGINLGLTHFTGELYSNNGGYNIESWFEKDDIKNGKEEGQISVSLKLQKFIDAADGFDELNINVIKNRGSDSLNFKKNPKEFLASYKKRIVKKEVDWVPIVAYYNVNRTYTGIVNNIESNSTKGFPSDIKTSIYDKSTLRREPVFNLFEEWYIGEEIQENRKKVESGDLNFQIESLAIIREAFRKFLSQISENKFTGFKVLRDDSSVLEINKIPRSQLGLIKGNDSFKFSQLSSGERMLLNLVFDLSRRLVIANGLRNSSLEGDGVVLIDELDLHLHPEWQRGIVAALKKTFPNLQFICTTHSAQILSTITDYDIFIVENGAIFNPSSNPLGRDNDDILEEIMGTSKRPKDVEKLISDIFHGLANSIIDFDSIERQKNLLAILVSPEDPIHNKIQSILERRKILAS